MKYFTYLTLLVLICSSMSSAYDLFVGNSFNTHLIHTALVKSRTAPFRIRARTYFYSSPEKKIIKGVIARDLGNTQATVTVTAGSVGFPYVSLRFRSERGTRLNYSVEIYA